MLKKIIITDVSDIAPSALNADVMVGVAAAVLRPWGKG